LVAAWRDVAQHAFHQRSPHARVGEQPARGHSDGVKDVVRRKRVVDLPCPRLAQQQADTQIERVDLAPGQSPQKSGCGRQRRLLFVIEGIEHAQRSGGAVRVRAPASPARTLEPALEQILERLLEALDPLGALGAEIQDLDIGDELVLLEQVVGAVDGCLNDLDQARQELRATLAQQRPRFVTREQQLAVGIGGGGQGRRQTGSDMATGELQTSPAGIPGRGPPDERTLWWHPNGVDVKGTEGRVGGLQRAGA